MIGRFIIGGVLGAVIGFGVYRFIGCASGTCPITSNPWMSTFFGLVTGLLVAGTR